jgi:predicted ATPase
MQSGRVRDAPRSARPGGRARGRGPQGRLPDASFPEQVRDALGRLYDPVFLQTHPLAAAAREAAGPTGPRHPGKALQEALTEAVEALRPRRGAVADPAIARGHRLLVLRYVDALPVREVQRRLAVGRSLYFEEHRRALEAVASLLRERWRGAGEAAPAGGGVPTARTLLPVPLTSFVGREAEVAEVGSLLSTVRLLTLTGPGGIGKTRLAVEVARRLAESYPDGVCFVDLAAVAAPELVPAAAAQSLGVHDAGGRPLEDQLAFALRGRTVLLLLDNCEHVLEPCARLVDLLLRQAPGLRVLATSRELLGVSGETVWRVPPLAVPSAGEEARPLDLERCEAVRLFLERAHLGHASFALTDANGAPVAQICRRLDGMPLAIELAAARLRVLAVDQIAERLDDRFRLLTTGGRTALPRQQTLRATLDWSHDLLSETERTLFRRLAVFAGSITLEAAEAVCAGEDIARADVLDLLARLLDKSLVVGEVGSDGTGRYRLLETARAYALERLGSTDELTSCQERYAAHYLRMAEEAVPLLWGRAHAPGSTAWSRNTRTCAVRSAGTSRTTPTPACGSRAPCGASGRRGATTVRGAAGWRRCWSGRQPRL